MDIPENVILLWTGTNAGIPAGWSRETDLDDKFTKGWGDENPNTTGGSATHVHTSTSHTHTLEAHTHTYSLTSAGTTSTGMDTSVQNYGIIDTHTHTGTSGAASGGETAGSAAAYGTASNDPPYRKVIYIKASATANLAENIVALYNSNTPPTNWTNVTELSGRFMKGASTGADADLITDNGSSTNSHSITHTHAANTHTHVAANSGVGSPQTKSKDVATSAQSDHLHSVTLDAATQNVSENTDTLVTGETVQPAYAILQAIKMGASGTKANQLIGMWLGTAASVPFGWFVCDGTNGTKDLRNKFIKIGDPAGANGGSNTHTHAAQAHSHTGSGTHTHTGSAAAHVNGTGTSAAATTHATLADSVHPVASVSTPTTNYASANTTADSSSNQPAYRTVAFIEYKDFKFSMTEGLSDSVTGATDYKRVGTNTQGLTDSVTFTMQYGRSIADDVGFTDALTYEEIFEHWTKPYFETIITTTAHIGEVISVKSKSEGIVTTKPKTLKII